MSSGSRLRAALLVTLTTIGCSTLGCGNDATNQTAGDPLKVFAAASLAEVFEEIAADITEGGGPDIEIITAGSTTLVTQLEQGAEADVLATADTTAMDRALLLPQTGEPVIFATNRIVLATPADNSATLLDLNDLAARQSAGEGLLVAACGPAVPCGRLTRDALAAEGTTVDLVTEEPSVRRVLAKLTLDEVDAGFVYRSDALLAAEQVDIIDRLDAATVVNEYPIVTLSSHPGSRAFVDALLGVDAQEHLTNAGFGTAQPGTAR